MKRMLSTPALIVTLVLLNVGFCAALFGGTSTLTTLISAPSAHYKELVARTSFTAGTSGTPLTTLTFNGPSSNNPGLTMKNNGTQTYLGGNGGNFTVTGNVIVGDTNTTTLRLFEVTSSNGGRVGIGSQSTATPQATLEVRPNPGSGNGNTTSTSPVHRGDIKAMIVTAHLNVQNYTFPWAEMNAQYNAADSRDKNQNDGARAGFSAIGSDNASGGGYYWATTHIDGDPLLIQTIDKSNTAPITIDRQGMTSGGGFGQVVIRGFPTVSTQFDSGQPYNGRLPAGKTADNAVLIVGEWDNTVYSGLYTPDARAYAWNTISSRSFKKDIQPLVPSDYSTIAEHLLLTDVYHYHYHGDSADSKLRTGFIAEEAPQEIVPRGRQMVGMQDTVGFLLASLKAVKSENDAIAERIERLRS